MEQGKASYAREGGTWVLRLEGELRFTLSAAINQLLDRAFADPDTRHFVVDLSRAESIDSTNLGVLARIARFARRQQTPPPTLIAPNPAITELLQGICFDQLFTILPSADYDAGQLAELEDLPTSEREMLELTLEAHRRLCEINEQNRDVFKDVVDVLEQATTKSDS